VSDKLVTQRCLLWYNALQSGIETPTFQKNLLLMIKFW